MSNKAIICYTGIGSKPSGKHTEKEFLKAMNTKVGCQGSKCPVTLKGWVQYSGADMTSVKECDKAVKDNKRRREAGKKAQRDTDNLKKCINTKCEKIIKHVKENMTDNNLSVIGVCASQKCQKEAKKSITSNQKYNKI